MHTTVETLEGARTAHHIGGEWRAPKSGRYIESYDPTTGQPWYEAADGGAEDIADAVAAAKQALRDPAWHRISQTQRGALMRRLAELVAASADQLGEIECRDNGKLLKEMKAQAQALPNTYTYFAGMADKIQGDTNHNQDTGSTKVIHRRHFQNIREHCREHTNNRNIDRSSQCYSRKNVINILRSWLSRSNAWNKSTVFL